MNVRLQYFPPNLFSFFQSLDSGITICLEVLLRKYEVMSLQPQIEARIQNQPKVESFGCNQINLKSR